MTTQGDDPKSLDVEAYARTQARIARRAKVLPHDKLETLAREAIARLAQRSDAAQRSKRAPTPQDITHLSQALIGDDDMAAARIVLALQARGLPVETIYLSYLGPAARQLGEWWDNDRVPFWKVTIGTGRLLAILRTLATTSLTTGKPSKKAATFATVPGEQHTLGLKMAADLFRRDGWDITLLLGLDHEQLLNEIDEVGNILIGLSVSGERALDALARLVVAIRMCDPTKRVFVSGPEISNLRARLSALDLDGVAETVEEAKAMMSQLTEDHPVFSN